MKRFVPILATISGWKVNNTFVLEAAIENQDVECSDLPICM